VKINSQQFITAVIYLKVGSKNFLFLGKRLKSLGITLKKESSKPNAYLKFLVLATE